MSNSFSYRSKVVEIEAYQFFGKPNPRGDITEFHPQWFINAIVEGIIDVSDPYCLFIKTIEGTMRAIVGDWIIRGLEGELYPCKPSVFEKKYEKV